MAAAGRPDPVRLLEGVVSGLRMMQAASDIYLGWTTANLPDTHHTFDRSITNFAERYADQSERDHQAFADAIRSGRLQALEGV